MSTLTNSSRKNLIMSERRLIIMGCLFPLNKYAWFHPVPVHFECPSEDSFPPFAHVFLYSSDGFFVPSSSCTTCGLQIRDSLSTLCNLLSWFLSLFLLWCQAQRYGFKYTHPTGDIYWLVNERAILRLFWPSNALQCILELLKRRVYGSCLLGFILGLVVILGFIPA